MASNVPTLSAGNILSASSHWNVMKADVDQLWDNFPEYARCDHRAAIITAGTGPLVAQYAAAFSDHDGAAWYFTTPADGDTFTHSVMLAPGTYTLYVYGITSAISAKIDWTLGGNSIATGQDWYSGGTVGNVTKTVTGISIADPGRYVLEGTVNGRYGSSSGWRVQLTRYWLTPASFS